MKGKVLLLMLLSMVVTANAGLVIWVKLADQMWAEYADSKLTITPSTDLIIGVFDLTNDASGPYALGLTSGSIGAGSLDMANAEVFDGVADAALLDDQGKADELGIQNPFISFNVETTQLGYLVRYITFHCDGPGDATIAVVDDNGVIQDTQVIHQIPEPMTSALLGLGGLALVARSRKRSA